MAERFVLNSLESGSPLWQRIREHLLVELANLRKKNDDVNLSPEKTAAIRGEIARVLKTLDIERVITPD